MSEKEILAETYYDRMDVYRPFKEEIGGETIFRKGVSGEKIYADIPCALSGRSSGGIVAKDSKYTVDNEYVIFCRPEIKIKENDFIVLRTDIAENPGSYNLKAGSLRVFKSHSEILVKESVRV